MDWILFQMRLVDTEDDQEDWALEAVPIEKLWRELVHRKKEKGSEVEGHVYFKNVQTYEDCKLVVNNCKVGAAEHRGSIEQISDVDGILKPFL